MIDRNIKCKKNQDAPTAEIIKVSFPENINEACSEWGEGVAMSLIRRSFDIDVQRKYRHLRNGGKTTDALDEAKAIKAMITFKPELGRTKKSQAERARDDVSEMDHEARVVYFTEMGLDDATAELAAENYADDGDDDDDTDES